MLISHNYVIVNNAIIRWGGGSLRQPRSRKLQLSRRSGDRWIARIWVRHLFFRIDLDAPAGAPIYARGAKVSALGSGAERPPPGPRRNVARRQVPEPRTRLETGSNDVPEGSCCPVRSSAIRKEAARCVPNPCQARQDVGVRRSSSRQQRKSIPKLKPTPRRDKPRPRKPHAYARFGSPRKQPRTLHSARRRQRRRLNLRRPRAFHALAPSPSEPRHRVHFSWAEALVFFGRG